MVIVCKLVTVRVYHSMCKQNLHANRSECNNTFTVGNFLLSMPNEYDECECQRVSERSFSFAL